MSYNATRDRVEQYFDQTATAVWERLTSDAPVSRIRETVRRGRNQMRDTLLGALPKDLSGMRVLDAGCGAGAATQPLAARGADVVAVDLSPALLQIAKRRLADNLRDRVRFMSCDLNEVEGPFDAVFAMDSLIYYTRADILETLRSLSEKTHGKIVFTVAPKTPLLMAMWQTGKLFPRKDRSPVMVPQATQTLLRSLQTVGASKDLGRVSCGFYISHALEVRV